MDTRTLQELKRLRDSLNQRYTGFPIRYCEISSNAVTDAFGFDRAFGLFIDRRGIGHGHNWNITPDGEIVDLTARQFGRFPRVYILDRNSHKARKYYLEGVYYMT